MFAEFLMFLHDVVFTFVTHRLVDDVGTFVTLFSNSSTCTKVFTGTY